MTTIIIPPEVEGPLTEEAKKQGTTPELLAVDYLRKQFSTSSTHQCEQKKENLSDFLSGYVGTVDGTKETLSENCGQLFTQELTQKQQREET